MTTLAHISDLHFGREDPEVVAGLRAELRERRPDLVVCSGDLTQRARRREFAAAAAFLGSLDAPVLVVPGNHDIPLFDVVRRFLRPLHRYRRYVTGDLSPLHRGPGLAVLGLNTARPTRWKDGSLSPGQIESLPARFGPPRPGELRVLVTHHPFVPRPGDPEPALVRRGPEALRVAEGCGVDVLLAGHIHYGYVADVRAAHPAIRRAIIVAQAGTAVSRRRRHEPNTYNLVHADAGRLTFEVRIWRDGRFAEREARAYRREGDDWVETGREPGQAARAGR
jgi:3',5'-cyclic AMP phosphodiesterase CpdA